MPALVLQLSLGSDKIVRYYRGQVKTVIARATSGQTVQFPASALQKHIRPEGVRGTFTIVFDEHYKFVSLERAEPGE